MHGGDRDALIVLAPLQDFDLPSDLIFEHRNFKEALDLLRLHFVYFLELVQSSHQVAQAHLF